jgi:hypothetical protein
MTASTLFPVTKSFLSQVALAETIATAYGISDVRCQCLRSFATYLPSVPAMNVDHWGSAYLHAFLDQSLAQLREKMKTIR